MLGVVFYEFQLDAFNDNIAEGFYFLAYFFVCNWSINC